MVKQIDIHNFKDREISIKALLEKSQDVSDKNKSLIFDFVDDVSLKVRIGYPRRIKLISTLKQLSLKIGKDFDKVTDKELEKVVAKIQSNEDYSAWTISDYVKILKKFYKWLNEHKGHSFNVDWMNGTIKEKDKPKLKRSDFILEQEAHKLVEVSETARNKAIFSLIWDCGARIGELGGMTIKSVHFEDQGTIVDLSGKTGKRSTFVIESTPHLMNWINLHPLKDNPDAPLWINMGQDPKYKYHPISYRMYYKMFERTFKKAKIKKKFNPHIFRHSRALWCVQNDWNGVMANKMFGWGMSSNMYNYYVSLATEDLKDKMLDCYGLPNRTKKEVEERKPKECHRCKAINGKEARFCFKCGFVLDMETAKELMKKQELEKELHADLFKQSIGKAEIKENATIQDALFEVLKKDKKLIAKLKEIVS